MRNKLNSARAVKVMKGFTLVELMLALVIIGVLASMAAPSFIGYLETAEARKINDTILKVDGEIKNLATQHHITNCASGTRLVNSGNSYLDVIFNGSTMVLSAMRNAYDRGPHTNFTTLFDEVTAAVSGSSIGVYEIENMPFSILSCTTTDNVYRIQNVRTAILESMLEDSYPRVANSFSASTAVISGPIRYSEADSNDEHQVDIYVRRD